MHIRSRLERNLRPHRERVELRAGIGKVSRADLPGVVTVQVAEHEADVPIDVPVQRDGVDEQPATCDAVHRALLRSIMLTRSPTSQAPQPVPSSEMRRHDAAIGGRGWVVLAGLAGKCEGGLRVAAIELHACQRHRLF